MSSYWNSIHFAERNECETNPCVNGGACSDLINSVHCNCTEPYYGSRCENSTFHITVILSRMRDTLFAM